MKDGQLNLATLAVPADKKEAVEKQSSQGYTIRLGKVIADVDARYDAPDQTVHALAKLEAHAKIGSDGKIEAGLDALDVQTEKPLRASLTGKGGATIDGSAIAAKAVALNIATDGAELRKLLPDVKLRGKWNVDVKADGPADKLAVSRVARPPAGRLAVDATLATRSHAPVIGWSATVNARGIDPGAAVTGRRTATCASTPVGTARGRTGRSI